MGLHCTALHYIALHCTAIHCTTLHCTVNCIMYRPALYLCRPFGIKYKGLKLLDVPQTNISLHFNEVVQFIEEGLEGGGALKCSAAQYSKVYWNAV